VAGGMQAVENLQGVGIDLLPGNRVLAARPDPGGRLGGARSVRFGLEGGVARIANEVLPLGPILA